MNYLKSKNGNVNCTTYPKLLQGKKSCSLSGMVNVCILLWSKYLQIDGTNCLVQFVGKIHFPRVSQWIQEFSKVAFLEEHFDLNCWIECCFIIATVSFGLLCKQCICMSPCLWRWHSVVVSIIKLHVKDVYHQCGKVFGNKCLRFAAGKCVAIFVGHSFSWSHFRICSVDYDWEKY